METTIASLEEKLAAVHAEKEETLIKNEMLASELELVSINLSKTNSDMEVLREEVSGMKSRLAESESSCNEMEASISLLLEEKEELAMQLANSLLEMEEEKVIWSSKEKASIEALADKAKLSNAELASLSKNIEEVKHELESFRNECEVLKEKLKLCEENADWERKCSMDKTVEIDQLRLEISNMENETSREVKHELESFRNEYNVLKERLNLSEENTKWEKKCSMEKTAEIDRLKLKISEVETENCQELTKARVDMDELRRKLSDLDMKIHQDTICNINEKAKLRMRLRSTQAKLDAHRGRHREAMDEIVFMNKQYEEASTNLKKQLAAKGIELLHYKKLEAEKKMQAM